MALEQSRLRWGLGLLVHRLEVHRLEGHQLGGHRLGRVFDHRLRPVLPQTGKLLAGFNPLRSVVVSSGPGHLSALGQSESGIPALQISSVFGTRFINIYICLSECIAICRCNIYFGDVSRLAIDYVRSRVGWLMKLMG